MSGVEKLCPFCGGELWLGEVMTPNDDGGFDVTGFRPWCKKCNVSLDTSLTRALAITAWNHRTPDPAQIRADAIRDTMETIMPLLILSSYDRQRIKASILALLDTPLSPTDEAQNG